MSKSDRSKIKGIVTVSNISKMKDPTNITQEDKDHVAGNIF